MFEKRMLNKGMLGKHAHMAAVFAAGTLLMGLIIEPSQAQTHSSGRAPETITQLIATQSIATQPIATGTPTNAANGYQTLYVNPDIGNDRAQGDENQPLQTITRALEIAVPNTVIVLAPGRYTQATGEIFPLRIQSGVTIQGAPSTRNHTAIIEGGGNFESPLRAQRNAAVIAADRAGIAQVAISNPDGYGVWVESASPTILETALVGNRRTGIYIAGGSPLVQGGYFSGNQVAGVIVWGNSSAQIQGNIFDGTGDAIRVIDKATPEIIGNRMTNNEAGLVLIGNANPTLRDNQMVGNRRNDIVEVIASGQDISSPAGLPVRTPSANLEWVSQVTTLPAREPVTTTWGEQLSGEQPSGEQTSGEQTSGEQTLIEADAVSNRPPVRPAADSAIRSRRLANRQSAGTLSERRENSRPGFRRASRAVTDGNPETRPRRRRRPANRPANHNRPTTRPAARPNIRPDVRPEASPEVRLTSPSVNNNRLAVPNSDIPLGSGGERVIFSAPRIGVGAPPAPPSRAQALGLYYRVFVEAPDLLAQDEVKAVVPDAFRTNFEGRSVMQVGAFETEDEAEERRRLLEDNNLDVRVEYIR